MRLLIISCGARKIHFDTAMPAVDVYDGPTYKIIRRAYQKNLIPKDLKLLIISAKYCVIELQSLIKFYEKKMTPELALGYRSIIESQLRGYIQSLKPQKIHLILSELYKSSFPNVISENKWRIESEDRSLGYKLQTVKKLIMGELS